jgi:hypothetical protein
MFGATCESILSSLKQIEIIVKSKSKGTAKAYGL